MAKTPTGERRFRQQDRAYHFPYHYIPHFDSKTGAGVQLRHLDWGLEYLCYTRHVEEMVHALAPHSVLDVGCGDGRVLGMLGPTVPQRVGVDLSERAIRFARAFHPDVSFQVSEASELAEIFDLVLAIEVLEHIPPDRVSGFLRSLSERVRPGGGLIICVPTPQARMVSKHYRHYDLDTLLASVRKAGAELSLTRADYVVPVREPFFVHLVKKLCLNRWWMLDIYRLRRPLWEWLWSHRLTPAGRGRHLVALFAKGRSGPIQGG